MLGRCYPAFNFDDTNNLQFVQHWSRQIQHWRNPWNIYLALANCLISSNIRIEGDALFFSDIVADTLNLATSRPNLRHVLLILLPEYINKNANYLIFLLSQPSTCDVALFYLTKKKFTHSNQGINSPAQHFENGYHELICLEYLRTLASESDIGERLLSAIIFLGDNCNLNIEDFSQKSEYKLLLCLLNKINKDHIIRIGHVFIQYIKTRKKSKNQHQKSHLYLFGFWIIENLENISDEQSIKLRSETQNAMLEHYKSEFFNDLNGTKYPCDLAPNFFFSTLPWHKLHENVTPILLLSRDFNSWQVKLSRSSENSYVAVSAIRHYFQVLMCLGRSQKDQENRERVNKRIGDIACAYGFGPREQGQYIFDTSFYENKYDLWLQFCTYINIFPKSDFDDFIERCASLIPLNQFFVLLECCHVIARLEQLTELISTRQSTENDDLGLTGLEQAFISAWHYGHFDLARMLLANAKAFLSQERFVGTKYPNIIRGRKVWRSYEYKLQLMDLHKTLECDPEEFQKMAHRVEIPHEAYSTSMWKDDREQRQECEYFRRYLIGAAYYKSNPEKCITIIEALYEETKNPDHSFLLFVSRLSQAKNSNNILQLREALSKFLSCLGDTSPEDMPLPWVASILDAHRELQDSSAIDTFWLKLSSDQQTRKEILEPYCLALMARGDQLIAQQIVNRYRELNIERIGELGISELLDKIYNAMPIEKSLRQNIHMLIEESQRTTMQLRRHYTQIVTKEFKDYVTIVSPETEMHEFLKNMVLEVANELLLRKKNLQLQSDRQDKGTNFRITQEDLINDWFTSLFDKRMAEARLGCRDQKRGGASASGKNVGEIDAFITDAKSRRIAIFEAFRLFSIDTTVIFDHLDKIAGYDQEGISPAFIIVYCDVENFSKLTQGYSTVIAKHNYKGFAFSEHTEIKLLRQNDNLWLAEELRYRNDQEIIFYHLLLNMHYSTSEY